VIKDKVLNDNYASLKYINSKFMELINTKNTLCNCDLITIKKITKVAMNIEKEHPEIMDHLIDKIISFNNEGLVMIERNYKTYSYTDKNLRTIEAHLHGHNATLLYKLSKSTNNIEETKEFLEDTVNSEIKAAKISECLFAEYQQIEFKEYSAVHYKLAASRANKLITKYAEEGKKRKLEFVKKAYGLLKKSVDMNIARTYEQEIMDEHLAMILSIKLHEIKRDNNYNRDKEMWKKFFVENNFQKD